MKVKDSFRPPRVNTRVTSSPTAVRSACLNLDRFFSDRLTPAPSANFGPLAVAAGVEAGWSCSPQGFAVKDGSRENRKLEGVAKLRFCASTFVQQATPITSPRSLTSGPPLFPPEIGQETWSSRTPPPFRTWLTSQSLMLKPYPSAAPKA